MHVVGEESGPPLLGISCVIVSPSLQGMESKTWFYILPENVRKATARQQRQTKIKITLHIHSTPILLKEDLHNETRASYKIHQCPIINGTDS